MNGTPLLPSVGAGVVAGLCVVAWRLRAADRAYESIAALPAPLRWTLRMARLLAATELASPPRRIRMLLMRRLARAGLADVLDERTWTSVVLTCGASGLLLGLAWAACAGAVAVLALLCAGIAPAWAAQYWLRARAAKRVSALVKELPATIDLLVLCLESGASIGASLHIAHEKSVDGATRDLLAGILAQIRTGRGRAEAFRHVMERLDVPEVTGLLTALIQADTRGMSLGPALRAQSAQCIAERFIRAERAALQAPVKLLMPLLLCIFPCTFIVIGVPIAARLAGQGAP